MRTGFMWKALHYRELARDVMDDSVRVEIEKLATEYETAARREEKWPTLMVVPSAAGAPV